MATGGYGKLEEFGGRAAEFDSYVERMEQYFIANDLETLTLADDRSNEAHVKARNIKRRAIFLSMVGADTYSLLRNLVSPGKPTDKTLDDLIKLLTEHYHPAPNTAIRRYKFYNGRKKPGESVADFVAHLRKLAEECQFGDTFDDMMRDQLVCGIGDDKVQRRMFVEKNLTFQSALISHRPGTGGSHRAPLGSPR